MGTKARRYRKILRKGHRINQKAGYWLRRSKKQNKLMFESTTTIA